MSEHLSTSFGRKSSSYFGKSGLAIYNRITLLIILSTTRNVSSEYSLNGPRPVTPLARFTSKHFPPLSRAHHHGRRRPCSPTGSDPRIEPPRGNRPLGPWRGSTAISRPSGPAPRCFGASRTTGVERYFFVGPVSKGGTDGMAAHEVVVPSTPRGNRPLGPWEGPSAISRPWRSALRRFGPVRAPRRGAPFSLTNPFHEKEVPGAGAFTDEEYLLRRKP